MTNIMKLVLQQRGIEIECTCDEFQQIYPAISNGKETLDSIPEIAKAVPQPERNATSRSKRSLYREGSNPQKVLEFMQKHPNKSFTAIDLVGKVPCTERTLHGVLSRLARDGRIKRSEKGHYVFSSSLSPDDAEAETNGIQSIQGVSKEPSEEMSEEMVLEMWHHVKPLFDLGKSVHDSQIMKMFANQDRKIIYKWIVQACHTGLIEQDVSFSGFYKIVRTEQGMKAEEPKSQRKIGVSELARGNEQLKTKIVEVMNNGSPCKRWKTRKLAEKLNFTIPLASQLLQELSTEGKIHRSHYSNGMNPNKQKLYCSLEPDESEPAPTVLNEREEVASLI